MDTTIQKNELINSYLLLEKKQKKLIEQMQENSELMQLLSDKITEAFSTKKTKYIPIEESKILKEIGEEIAKMPPKEAQKIRDEVARECGLL